MSGVGDIVDSLDITQGLVSLTLHVGANQVPKLELDLQLISEAGLESVEAEMELGISSHEALVALGWAPPADEVGDPV